MQNEETTLVSEGTNAAFQVICDRTNNTPEDQAAQRVNVDVVLPAPVADQVVGPLIYGQHANKVRNLGKSYFLQGREAAEAYVSLLGGEWQHRRLVEEDPTWRQVIPYVIIQNVDTGMIVVMNRTVMQGEKRLHGNVYIGAGGHIEKEDSIADMSSHPNIIVQAAWREVIEETGFTSGHMYNVGILCVNHPDEPLVQRVHVGVVYHLFTHETVFKGEIKEQEARWEDPAGLAAQFSKLEPWSQLVANYYMKCFHQPA